MIDSKWVRRIFTEELRMGGFRSRGFTWTGVKNSLTWFVKLEKMPFGRLGIVLGVEVTEEYKPRMANDCSIYMFAIPGVADIDAPLDLEYHIIEIERDRAIRAYLREVLNFIERNSSLMKLRQLYVDGGLGNAFVLPRARRMLEDQGGDDRDDSDITGPASPK